MYGVRGRAPRLYSAGERIRGDSTAVHLCKFIFNRGEARAYTNACERLENEFYLGRIRAGGRTGLERLAKEGRGRKKILKKRDDRVSIVSACRCWRKRESVSHVFPMNFLIITTNGLYRA